MARSDDAMNTRTCNAPALPSGTRTTPRQFFWRMLFATRERPLTPAGRETARRFYLRAVEAELASFERIEARRARTLAGMAAVVPPYAYHTHTGRRR